MVFFGEIEEVTRAELSQNAELSQSVVGRSSTWPYIKPAAERLADRGYLPLIAMLGKNA
jgi:hypothetical protein